MICKPEDLVDRHLQPMPVPKFMELDFPEQRWLVEGIWPEGGCGFIAGPPKSYKSFLALEMAIAVATGSEFLGAPVPHRGRVLCLDSENISREIQTRIRLLSAGRSIDPHNLHGIDVVPACTLKLDTAEGIQELSHWLMADSYRLVIIDSMVRFHNLRENESDDMSRFQDDLRALCVANDTGLCLIHHFNKPSAHSSSSRKGARLRGSSDMWAWMDCSIYMERKKADVALSFESRYGPPAEDRKISVLIDDHQVLIRGSDGTLQCTRDEQVLEVLATRPEGLTKSGVRKHIEQHGPKVSNPTIGNIMARLYGDEYIERFRGKVQGVERDLFRLTEKGQQRVFSFSK